MTDSLPERAVAERLAGAIVAGRKADLPSAVRARCEEMLIDVVGRS